MLTVCRGTATATRHDFANVNSAASCHPPDSDIASAYKGRLAHFDPTTRKSALKLVHASLMSPIAHYITIEALVAMGFEGQNPSWRDIKGRPSFCYHQISVKGLNVMVVDTFSDGHLGTLVWTVVPLLHFRSQTFKPLTSA